MSDIYHVLCFFFVYGFLGWCTEVAYAAYKSHKFVNRGFLNGPICPVYGISVSLVILLLEPAADNLFLLYISSFVLVSALEWLTGFLLEKLFHNKWWDYSNMPLNINGYVCLLFSLMWGAACVFIVRIFHPLVLTVTGFIPVPLGVILLAGLTCVLLCDVYVTASGILKMNKRLAKMEEISAELHEISDRIGENIFEHTITALEKQEELKAALSERQAELKESISEHQAEFMESVAERQQEARETMSEAAETVSAEVRERIAFLKKLYKETTENVPRIQKRLLHAFPKMESSHYKNALRDLKEKIKESGLPKKNS